MPVLKMGFFRNFRKDTKVNWVTTVGKSLEWPDGTLLLCYTFIA